MLSRTRGMVACVGHRSRGTTRPRTAAPSIACSLHCIGTWLSLTLVATAYNRLKDNKGGNRDLGQCGYCFRWCKILAVLGEDHRPLMAVLSRELYSVAPRRRAL